MTNTTVSSNKDMQMDFWDNMGEVFGYDIIGSESHPLKKAFELYCDMKKEQEEDESEEEEGEEEEEDWEMDWEMGGWENEDWVTTCLEQNPPRCPECGCSGTRSLDKSTCFGCEC